MNVASLSIAVAELKMTQSLIAALDAVAPGLGGNGQLNHPVDRYEPRTVIHPTPAYQARRVIHPTPRILPRPVLHPTPRIVDNTPPATVKETPANPIPWPIPPVWKTLPLTHSHSAPQILKIAGPTIDIRNKGTLIDLFI